MDTCYENEIISPKSKQTALIQLIEYMSNKLSKYNIENEAFEEELTSVEKELSIKKEIISKHRENMVQVDNHINSLTRRLTEMSVEIAPYRVKYSNCVRSIEPLEDSVQRKSKAVEQLEEKLNEERKRVKKLTEQIASMQGNLLKCVRTQQEASCDTYNGTTSMEQIILCLLILIYVLFCCVFCL